MGKMRMQAGRAELRIAGCDTTALAESSPAFPKLNGSSFVHFPFCNLHFSIFILHLLTGYRRRLLALPESRSKYWRFKSSQPAGEGSCMLPRISF